MHYTSIFSTTYLFWVHIHGTKTTLQHRQGEEHTGNGAYMITTPIYWELHTHDTHDAAQINPNRETPHNGD
jgi:hypothetical protein